MTEEVGVTLKTGFVETMLAIVIVVSPSLKSEKLFVVVVPGARSPNAMVEPDCEPEKP